MANTGNKFARTGENNAGIGATAWTTPGNVTADDAADATCNAAASSQYLVARNFDLASVPANATILGVTVRVEASEHSTGTEPLLAQLQNASGTLFGSSKSTSNEGSISGTGKAVYTYGSTSDLWGATITPAIVHDADFGVRLWFTTAHDVRIDYVTIAVEYSVPTPGRSDETDTALAVSKVKIRATGRSDETDSRPAAVAKKKIVYPAPSSLLTGMIGYWNLTEASGAVRLDSHLNGLHLQDNNTVGQSAGGGPDAANCADFVRAGSDFLSRQSEPLLRTGDIDFTCSIWARWNGGSAEYALISKDAAGQREFVVEIISGALIAHGTAVEVLNSGAMPTNTWVHVILEYEAAGNVFRIYRDNGSPVSHSDSIPVAAGTSTFQIGAREYVGAEDRWDGRLAYAGFWKRLLTASEKTLLYNGGAGLSYAAIAASVTPSIETDTAYALTATKISNHRCDETDTAFALGRTKIVGVGRADDTETAFALSVTKRTAVGRANETDSSITLSTVKVRSHGFGTETDSSAALSVTKRIPPGRADETDTAFALGILGGPTIVPTGRANETDTAFALTVTQIGTPLDNVAVSPTFGGGWTPIPGVYLSKQMRERLKVKKISKPKKPKPSKIRVEEEDDTPLEAIAMLLSEIDDD